MSEKQDIPTESPPPYSPPKHGLDAPESKPPPPPQYSASAPQAVTGGPSVHYPTNTQAPVGTAMHPTNAQQGPVHPVGRRVLFTNYFGRAQVRMTCPYCRKVVSSRLDKKPSTRAYLSSAIIFLMGCHLGCCFIPCCIDDCMNVEHKCPNCFNLLGRYEA